MNGAGEFTHSGAHTGAILAEGPIVVTQQLALAFDLPQRQTRLDFVVGQANRTAIEAIERWPDWPSRCVVLIGPEGSGKSHLARIFAGLSVARVHDCASADLHALAASPEPALVLENAGPGLDESGLFHLLNSLDAHRSHLLITARSHPSTWDLSLADLSSRLRAAAPLQIGEPDDRLLQEVVAKLFADRQTIVDPQLIRYMLDRMERSFAAAVATVDAIDRLALARKSAINRSLIATVLADRVPEDPFLPGFDPEA